MSAREKERAAAEQAVALARQQEYMSLAPGIGIVPEKFRNKGYEKLEFEPGEGGIRATAPAPAQGGGDMQAFLAGVAAGADPQKLAEQLLAGTPTTRGRRAAQKEAMN